MDDVRSPSSTELRALLRRERADAGAFDAFCQDYFPEVYRRFTNNMDRVVRETLLLTHADPHELLERLSQR